jgi:hypothetical protein
MLNSHRPFWRQRQRSPLRPRHLERRINIYATKGGKAFEEWLNTTGVENINNVNKALEKAHS